jgi:hypothetical protein
LIGDNRTYDYKVSAMTAAAILEVKPIRFTHTPAPDQDLVRFSNWDCATRASTSNINVSLDQIDPEFVRRFHRATLGNIYLPSLRPYLRNFEEIFFINQKRGSLTFDEVEEAISFQRYNDITLLGHEMLQIERLINVYLLMKLSRDKIAPGQQGD